MKVAVIGCGPAGLLAAAAAEESGHKVSIYSLKRKSRIGGAQYLHNPIDGITPKEPESYIKVVKIGSKEGYAHKVYGDKGQAVSWDLYDDQQEVPAWDIIKAYDLLWDRYEPIIKDRPVSEELLFGMLGYADVVINAAPLKALCNRWHTFKQQYIFVRPVGMNLVSYESFILYNGDKLWPWYRSSRVFGREMTEWSVNAEPSQLPDGAFAVKKPVHTNCDCWPEIVKVGRYGKWKKSDLASNAFEDARAFFNGSHSLTE